jgi:acyl dehydratase
MAPKASELSVGQEFSEVVVDDLRQTQIVQYAGAGGDYNPLHTDYIYSVEVAKNPRGTIAHGMLTMGMTGRLLTETFGLANLKKYGGRFTAAVFPGDTLTATATIDALRDEDGISLVDLVIKTTNQEGQSVFTGTATVQVEP